MNLTINVSLADLRKNPSSISYKEARESQLLFGETVKLLENNGEWLKIAALQQPFFDEHAGWQPYTGWIHKSEAAPTTNTMHHQKPFSKECLIKHASTFLGTPYLWGGLSPAGIDCSGLIHLLYRSQGMVIPRNAHDQYLKAKPTTHLLPGNPLFLAKETRICHVILKLDATTFIEAPETGKNVRLLTWGKDIWEENGKLRIFDKDAAYKSYPASLC